MNNVACLALGMVFKWSKLRDNKKILPLKKVTTEIYVMNMGSKTKTYQ
jgi:hypothetical protein